MKNIAVLDIQQFDQSQDQDFYIRILSEHLTKNHHNISVPHKHNFYLTVLFTAGKGFHEVDFEHFEVKRGSVFFLNPGQTHYWELSDDIEGFIFFHSESFYKLSFSQNTLSAYPFFYSTQNSPFMQLNERTTLLTERRMAEIFREYLSDEPWKNRKITNLIDELYIDLARQYLNAEKQMIHRFNKYSEKLKQLETLIDLHYKEEKSAAVYAERMNLTAKHLNRIVQNTIGKTTTQLITERTILEAKRLISHSELNLTEIAEFLIQVCHNGQTICVASSALNTHLGHGDKLGACAPAARQAAPAAMASGLLELVAYPNPTPGRATLSFRSPVDGNAQVLIYNALGQRVASLYAGTVNSGQAVELVVKGETLAAGVYQCRLVLNGQSVSQRLVITR